MSVQTGAAVSREPEKFGVAALVTTEDVLAAVDGEGERLWNFMQALVGGVLVTIRGRGIHEFAVPQDGVDGHALRITVEWAGYPTKPQLPGEIHL